MKLTADDANFQNYIKNQTNYTFSQAERCKEKLKNQHRDVTVAGYITQD